MPGKRTWLVCMNNPPCSSNLSIDHALVTHRAAAEGGWLAPGDLEAYGRWLVSSGITRDATVLHIALNALAGPAQCEGKCKCSAECERRIGAVRKPFRGFEYRRPRQRSQRTHQKEHRDARRPRPHERAKQQRRKVEWRLGRKCTRKLFLDKKPACWAAEYASRQGRESVGLTQLKDAAFINLSKWQSFTPSSKPISLHGTAQQRA